MDKAFELAAAVEAALDLLVRETKINEGSGIFLTFENDAYTLRSQFEQMRKLSDEILGNVYEKDIQ